MAVVQTSWMEDVLKFPLTDDCIPWPFNRNSNGYGFVTWEGRRRLAHRVMCELVHGVPPSNRHEAAHLCGNGHGGCVNPRHLSWKTRAENYEDSRQHGTAPIGEKHGGAILCDVDVQVIRALRGQVGHRQIADEFGVSASTISHIHTRRLWAHIGESKSEPILREARRLAARIQAKKEARRQMR